MQFDLFPERVSVERLDPRSAAGSQTRLAGLYVVRFEREPGVHQVFVDHHGMYCGDHGRTCRAVREVTAWRDGHFQHRHASPPP